MFKIQYGVGGVQHNLLIDVQKNHFLFRKSVKWHWSQPLENET